MKHKLAVAVVCGFVLLLRAAWPMPQSPSPRYRVTWIGTIDAAQHLVRINNHGQILFKDHITDGHSRVVLANPASRLRYPGTNLKYTAVEANAINETGTVVGSVSGQEDGAWMFDYSVAALWRGGKGKGKVFSPTMSLKSAVGTQINQRNEIAGYSYNALPGFVNNRRAFFYTGRLLIDLGRGEACGLNDRGQVVICDARAETRDPTDSAEDPYLNSFVWQAGHRTLIVPPLGYSTLEHNSRTGINNAGEVTGTVRGPLRTDHLPTALQAYVWRSGTMTLLGTLGGINSYTNAINDAGQIVGAADTASTLRHAFLWQKGRMYDLNNFISSKSGWELAEAVSINDKGRIVGIGNKGAFLLTPISDRPLK